MNAMIACKAFDKLPEDARRIREEVFVKEQGFTIEFDDKDSISRHMVLYADGIPAGTCRVFWDDQQKSYVIGRVAVRKIFRGKHYGTELLKAAEQEVREAGGKTLALAAQVRVKHFYESLGYTASGEEFLDEFCPHVWMRKVL